MLLDAHAHTGVEASVCDSEIYIREGDGRGSVGKTTLSHAIATTALPVRISSGRLPIPCASEWYV